MGNTRSQDTQQITDLVELNDELENYFRNTIIPQLFVDANLTLRKYTPLAMKQFNFTADHIGMPIDELGDNIRYSTIKENIQEVIHSGDVLEKEIQTSDLKWFQMNIIPYIIQKNNKPNGVIITFIDITDRIKDIKELEKLNAAHETFIYSVSHDLKAPLANIEGLIQSLTGWENAKEKKSISEMLKSSVQIMRDIINELSEITKIEGNYQDQEESVNFEHILKEVKQTIQGKINDSHALIRTDIKESEMIFSRKNLRSILYNLLSNALKYKSPERNPVIDIKTEKVNDEMLISIKDNGLGIEEDKKDIIFSQFSRLEKKIEGTGIGLYLVKKIVDNAGGQIFVNSILGKGSEFNVILKTK